MARGEKRGVENESVLFLVDCDNCRNHGNVLENKNTAQIWSLCRIYWRDRGTILLYFHDVDRLLPRIIGGYKQRKEATR